MREREGTRKQVPINGLHNASNLSIEKALVDFAVTNEVLQELSQCDKAIFYLAQQGSQLMIPLSRRIGILWAQGFEVTRVKKKSPP